MFASKCVSAPYAIVRIEAGSEPGQPPPSLKSLAVKAIVNLITGLTQHPQTVKVENLQIYFLQLPSSLHPQIQDSVAHELSTVVHKYEQELLFLVWRLFFSDVINKLVLEEFLGNHWSNKVFQFCIQSHREFPAVKTLEIGSQQIDKKRLSYLFEITESTWKPELRILLSKLPNLVDLTLNEFCDDDTLSLVGKTCRRIKNLVIIIKPESFQEQQLTDDGFLDLIDSQEKCPSLVQIDISDCFTSAITAKAIINLEKITTLIRLHVRSSHLSWLHLYQKLMRQSLRPNFSVVVLSVYLGVHQEEVSAFFDGDNSIVSILPQVFPVLQDFNLFQWTQSLAVNQHLDGTKICPELSSLGCCTKVLSVNQCKNLAILPQLFPNVRELVLRDLKIHQDQLKAPFVNLKIVHLLKETLPISVGSVLDIMKHALKLTHIKVITPKIIDATDGGFIETFNQYPHLKNIQEFSISVTTREGCPLTILLVHFLVLHCPNLRRLDKLVTWNISKQDVDREFLLESGFGVVMAKRKHWSLPWKGEDGTIHHEGSLTF